MEMYVDIKNIQENNSFYRNDNMFDYYDYVYELQRIVDFLVTHNKNYTKEQYYKLLDLQDLIKELKIKEY